jgi:membrane protein implicated in regulation of membrane protease activity
MANADFAGWWNAVFLAPFGLGVLLVALSAFGLDDDDGDGELDADESDGWLALPSLMSVQSFLLWWGVLGWSANRATGNSAAALVISVPVALLGSVLLTIATSYALKKIGPQSGTNALGAGALEGRVGEADAAIASTCGSALVRDEHGTLHRIAARAPQDTEAIRSGEPVLVVAYDEESRAYRVARWKSGA